MSNQSELYRDFLDRKFDEVLQAIQAITPNRSSSEDSNEVNENVRTE